MMELNTNGSHEEENMAEQIVNNVLRLREEGNQLYRENRFSEAINVWFESIKQSLKGCCCVASSELIQNQIICRLNVSMAFLKLENWVDAKQQVQLVIEQQPRNVKALLRLARAYEGLQQWSDCRDILVKISKILRQRECELVTPDTQISENLDYDDRIIMGGLTREDVHKSIGEIQARIENNRKKYHKDKTRLLRYIGQNISKEAIDEESTN